MMKDIEPEIRGESTQLVAISDIVFQSIAEIERLSTPNPTIPPTIV